MEDLAVSRVLGEKLLRVGHISRQNPAAPSFAYHPSYLESENPMALSCSLPLREEPYAGPELRAYFEGLLPEGAMRTTLAARLGAREDDYLSLLASSGLDCIGDIVVCEEAEVGRWHTGQYAPLDATQLDNLFSGLESLTSSNVTSRLSLAGTQGKVGLAHVPDADPSEGWLQPVEGAASTHILKASTLSRIEELELICMGAADACGVCVSVERTDVREASHINRAV